MSSPTTDSRFSDVERQVREVVGNYVSGVLDVNLALIESVFSQEAVSLKGVAVLADGSERITVEPIASAKARWAAGKPQTGAAKILSLSIISDRAATVQLDFTVGSKRFIDILSLLRTGSEWKIVEKMFVVQ